MSRKDASWFYTYFVVPPNRYELIRTQVLGIKEFIDHVIKFCNSSKCSDERVEKIYRAILENHLVEEEFKKNTLPKLKEVVDNKKPL